MDENFNVKEILEFYMMSGVDETCGDVSVNLIRQNDNKVGADSVLRPATSSLAVASVEAAKNAADLCVDVSSIAELKKIIEAFEGCSLKNTATNTVIGNGNPEAKLMFIGEAPGADEDRIGRAFVGRSGKLLDKMLEAIGVTRNDCYICNILPWRPPGNRAPGDAEVAVCLPFLKKQIELVNPDIIFVLGAVAVNALLGNSDSISRMRGKLMEYETDKGKKIKVLAGYHPAYLLRTPAQKSKAWADFLRLKKEMMQNN